MKAIPILFFTCLLFQATSFAQDFRGATWGMSEAQIRRIESIELETHREPDGSTGLSGNDTVIGIPALITYMFVQDKLVAGTTGYFNLKIGDDPESAVTNISRIIEGLKTKYGDHGSPVDNQIGGLKIAWQTSSSDIVLATTTRDSIPIAMVLYYSRKLASLREQLKQKEFKEKF